MSSWWFDNTGEGGVTIGLGQYRGWLEVVETAQTATHIQYRIRATCDERKAYGRYVRVRTSADGAYRQDTGRIRINTTYADWHTWADTGYAAIDVAKGGTARNMPIWAVLEVDNADAGDASVSSYYSGDKYVTIPALALPAAPTGLSAAFSAGAVSLSWSWSAGGTYGQTFDVYRHDGSGAWAKVGEGLPISARSWTDPTAQANKQYTYLVKAWNAAGWSAGSNQATVLTATAPADVANIAANRSSDYSATVVWQNRATTTAPYSYIRVFRSVDNGGAAYLADVPGNAASYQDNTTSPNHTYAYGANTTNVAGWSSGAWSNTIANTPAAPTGLNAYRVDNNTVRIDFANPALTESGIKVQRSADGQAWADVKTVPGDSLAYVTDTPGGGTWYYRLAAVGSTGLQSAWSASSNAVVTIIAPAAPTLTAPASGSVASLAASPLRLQWRHNPIDGSAQTSTQVRISTDGGSTWGSATAVSGATAYIDIGLAQYAALGGSPVQWQVRTKGAHADYGPWSSASTFRAYQVPQASITAPATDGDVIADVPLVIQWDYSDMTGGIQAGTQQSATVAIHKDGHEAYRKAISGSASSLSVPASEFLPENNSGYTITLTVVSTTTLTASTQRGFAVDYLEPAPPSADIEVDEVLGSVQLVVMAGDDSEAADTHFLGVFRKNPDGRMVPLGDGLDSFATVDDLYPPLGQDITYVVVAYTANGLSSRTEYPVHVDGHGAFFVNYGDDFSRVAKLSLRGAISWAKEKDVTRITTSGTNPDPLSFYGSAMPLKGAVTGTIWRKSAQWPHEDDPSSYSDLKAADDTNAPVVLRRCGGSVIYADIAVRFSDGLEWDTMTAAIDFWKIRDGDGLAI
jgi:hypothetical protein